VQAQTAIDTVKAAILAHSATKLYSPESLTDTNLKTKMSILKKTFSTDIKALRDIVKVAHVAVKDAAVMLAQTPGIDEAPENNTVENSGNSNNN